MNRIILQPTATAQWLALVKEAENSSHLVLPEDLESYLVFLLVRFTAKSDIAKSVVGLEYLQSTQSAGQKQQEALRDIGDKCLIISGLFPGRAQRRRVRISYFVHIGQNAYIELSVYCQQQLSDLYKSLSKDFVSLMDVLHVVRELSSETSRLTPLQAEELWHDTASPHALSILRQYTKGMLIQPDEFQQKSH